jgi:hypothetical protein
MDQEYRSMRRAEMYKWRAKRAPFITFWIEPFWRTIVRVLGIVTGIWILGHWIGFW